MDITDVAPELRAPLKRMPALKASSALARRFTQAALALMPGVKLEGVSVRTVRAGGAALRLYTPAQQRSTAALLWIHGGGFVIGRAVQDDRLCAQTALALGIIVASAEYRLAPKHPFPAPLDDCCAAWAWLQDSAAALGVDPARIAVGGESAGGGLAACLVQRLHDEAGPGAAAQWLFCPMLDDRTAADRSRDAAGHFVWTNASNAFGWRAYLGAAPGAATAPAYAVGARREDLSGLPAAWIGVGDIDLFCEEDRAYAERLTAAGVAATFTTVPGAPHGFEAWAPDAPQSKALIAEAQAWLAAALGGPNASPSSAPEAGRSAPAGG
jgi:acetyl esterase/lipase